MEFGSMRFVLVVALVAGGWVSGCRPTEPGPLLNRDLGDGDRVLLPVLLRGYSDDISKGTAQLTRKDDFTPTEKTPVDPSAGAREFVREVNSLIVDQNFEELPKFFVEEQQDVAAAYFGAMKVVMDALNRFVDTAEQKRPGTRAAIEKMTGGGLVPQLKEDDLVMTSDTEGYIAMPTGKTHLQLIDGYWYLKDDSLPPADKVDAIGPAGEESVRRIDALTEDFKNDKVNALELATRIMQAMQPLTSLGQSQ